MHCLNGHWISAFDPGPCYKCSMEEDLAVLEAEQHERDVDAAIAAGEACPNCRNTYWSNMDILLETPLSRTIYCAWCGEDFIYKKGKH